MQMRVRTPPGLIAYLRVVVKAIRQSSRHRDLSDRAKALFASIRELERRVAEHDRNIEDLIDGAHGWMNVTEDQRESWVTEWRSRGRKAVAEAEDYLFQYAAIEDDILREAEALCDEYRNLVDERKKSAFQRALEALMRTGFDFLRHPDPLLEELRLRNRRLRSAAKTLKPGI